MEKEGGGESGEEKGRDKRRERERLSSLCVGYIGKSLKFDIILMVRHKYPVSKWLSGPRQNIYTVDIYIYIYTVDIYIYTYIL